MRIEAACEYCGGVSRKVLYQAVALGELRAARPGAGRMVVFSETWLDAWLQSRAEFREVRDGRVVGAIAHELTERSA